MPSFIFKEVLWRCTGGGKNRTPSIREVALIAFTVVLKSIFLNLTVICFYNDSERRIGDWFYVFLLKQLLPTEIW